MLGVDLPLPDEIRRNRAHLKSQQVLHLAGEDDQGDAGGESESDRVWDELDGPAESGESHDDKDDARHQSRDPQSVEPVLLDDSVDNHDEGAGRSPDLHPGAAQRRDDESRDDRRVEAALRRYPAGDGEGDGQWQRDNSDYDSGD